MVESIKTFGSEFGQDFLKAHDFFQDLKKQHIQKQFSGFVVQVVAESIREENFIRFGNFQDGQC